MYPAAAAGALCEVGEGELSVTGLGTDRVTFDLHLSWVDPTGRAKPEADDKRRIGHLVAVRQHHVVTEISPSLWF